MKENLHPKTYEVAIACACGNVIHTLSTLQSHSIDICSKCHPFFTGKQKLMDTEGRIERFKKKYEKTQAGQKKK